MSLVLALVLAQPMNLNMQPVMVRDEGVPTPAGVRAITVNCVGAGVTCTQSGSTWTVSVAGGGGAPTSATFITQTPDATLTNEQAMSLSGNGIVVNTTGTGVLTIYTGASCTNQFIRALSATGAATCASVNLAADVTGLLPDSNLASNYSGVGACGANTFATTLNDNAAPSCAVVNDATGAVTGGIRLTTDLGGTAAAPTVVDDSHAHTGATISALDTADTTTGVFVAARGALGAVQPTCGAGDFLTCNGTVCTCATPAGGSSPLTTKGDLYTYTTVDARLGVGGDGNCLKADSTQATGLIWGSCGGAGSGTSFEQSVALTTAGAYTVQAVSLAATTATSKFVCQPFGTTADGLTPEAIAIAGLEITVSDLVAGVGLNLRIINLRGLQGTVRVHCTTGG